MIDIRQTNSIRLTAELGILTYYKQHLSKDMYDLIYADVQGRELTQAVTRLDYLNIGENQHIITQLFNEFIPIIDENLSNYSAPYLHYIISRTKLHYKIRSKLKHYDVSNIYYELKKTGNVLLRESLLSHYLLNSLYRISEKSMNNSNAYDECLNDAYNTITNKLYKKAIKEKLSKFKEGSTVYNFELPNAEGKTVSLSSLKGKVVLIDIYATICTGCRKFAFTLKDKVFPEFKDNKDVAFVAISIESDRKVWLKSIEDGHNTDKEHEIILYTDGLGVKHPFIKNYSIQAVPTLILVDKEGKIANSSSGSLTSSSSGEEVIKMIYGQLNKKENAGL